MAEDSTGVVKHCPIIQAWLDLPEVAARAAHGRIADLGTDGLTRESVGANADVLEPLIKEFGNLDLAEDNHMYECSDTWFSAPCAPSKRRSIFSIPGTRPSINQMVDVCGRYLFLCRPRGKKPPSSVWVAIIYLCYLIIPLIIPQYFITEAFPHKREHSKIQKHLQ